MTKALIVNGIDFLEYPPPDSIYRATQYQFAQDLIKNGNFKFTNLEHYKTIENEDYRDTSEGHGVIFRQGIRCNVGFVNSIYIFCASTNSNPKELLNCFAECDTVVQIHDVTTFTERILSYCRNQGFDGHGFVAGLVCYDKDNGGTRSHWGQEGIFQKHKKYNDEDEYRIALYRKNNDDSLYYNIELGNCSDIISIYYNK